MNTIGFELVLPPSRLVAVYLGGVLFRAELGRQVCPIQCAIVVAVKTLLICHLQTAGALVAGTNAAYVVRGDAGAGVALEHLTLLCELDAEPPGIEAKLATPVGAQEYVLVLRSGTAVVIADRVP